MGGGVEEDDKKRQGMSSSTGGEYGTFQGVANYPPPGSFPQPVPPPGASDQPPPDYYSHGGYQATVPGYAVVDGRPVRESRLPCCGLGLGWCLFIIGFFLAAVPWYVGVIILLCSRIDYREKPGYIACTVAAVLSTIAIILGATKGSDEWQSLDAYSRFLERQGV